MVRVANVATQRRGKHISALLRNSAAIGQHATMRNACKFFCAVGAEVIYGATLVKHQTVLECDRQQAAAEELTCDYKTDLRVIIEV
jgi:hypothetical protein